MSAAAERSGRVARRGAAAFLAAAAVLAGGCEVEPYCLSCMDGGEASLDAAADAGPTLDGRVIPRDDAQAPPDTGLTLVDGCLEGELCNELDDDCDGIVDEGFSIDTNPEHCGACGNFCNFAHARAQCVSGVCRRMDCEPLYYDINDDESDGCEYFCEGTSTDDAVCDNRDDDCDMRFDEDVDKAADPMNCGRCGRLCRFPHGAATCEAGECVLGTCEAGFEDVDGRASNGCEYACVPMNDGVEVCNARDDDCDGAVDEESPGSGEICGSDEGACQTGLTECRGGQIVCADQVRPTTETCNGMDDDCDGVVDNGNPGGGRVCGTSQGRCEVGSMQCVDGALACVGASAGTDEVCNGLDDDCDGVVDNGDPGGGAACGETEGACEAGRITCVGGALSCQGGTPARDELCNGVDDDCDGTVDEGSPGTGTLCGTDLGVCSPGRNECRDGALVCVGAIGGGGEACNGQDDDCDGTVDEGNPDGGEACGVGVGACQQGSRRCEAGVLVCRGNTGPTLEACNGADDDCDGTVDEDFDFTSDTRHCGGCGNRCDLPNAVERCSMGTCQVQSCDGGFVDLDANQPGCEYECEVRGGEICNGLDDDCDGSVDEEVVLPPNFCNPNGACQNTVARCDGAAGFTCTYTSADYEEIETRCDGVDNDCDGFSDEAYPAKGDACGMGQGECATRGQLRCLASQDGLFCDAAAPGAPSDEECNGLDDDCDGGVDERRADDPGTPYRDGVDLSAIDTVTVSLPGGGTMEVMQYEASRADASAGAGGTLGEIACSRPGVRPWVNVSWDDAQAACCALNEDGVCPGSGAPGWRLCDAPDWQAACEGPSGSCGWSYAASCQASQQTTCNGAEYDCDPSLPGDQDCLYETASSRFPMCFTDWGPAGGVYDLSGNVREWTSTAVGSGIFQVRGGSFQHVERGRGCGWDFTVARGTDALPNTGFRCCMY